MEMYSNLTIRTKLILGYAVVMIFGCCVGFFGIKGMAEIKSRLNDMRDNLIPSITCVNEIDHHAQQHRRFFLRYLMEQDTGKREQLTARLEIESNQIRASIEKMATYPLLPDEKKLLKEINQVYLEYLVYTRRVLAKSQSGQISQFISDEHEQTFILFSNLEELLKKLSQFNVEEADTHFEQSSQTYTQLVSWMIALILLSVVLTIVMTLQIIKSIADPLRIALDAVRQQQFGNREKTLLVQSIAAGDLSQQAIITPPFTLEIDQIANDEAGMLLKAIGEMSTLQHSFDLAIVAMTDSLRHNRSQEQLRDWFKNGQNELNFILRGDKTTTELTQQALVFITEYLSASVGAFYVYDDFEEKLKVSARYAQSGTEHVCNEIVLGEGVAGQAALERKTISLHEAPGNYLQISSGLGETSPAHIISMPLVYNDELYGLIEIGALANFSENQLEFLKQIMEALAVTLSVSKSRRQVNELLEQTQGQAEELRVQQEELQQTNEELEERAQMLEQQREQIRAKNREVEHTSQELQKKADELERVSTYKSEFLANMSHELRTPLNSLMILSSLLRNNKDGNLTDRQVEFAATINGAGRDLLNLINDILDLSKIESGHLEFHYENVALADICTQLESTFHPIATDKGINFSVFSEPTIPETIICDAQRMLQILKNLLSNACKFTAQGSVSMRIYTPDVQDNILSSPAIALAVTDTGIGIPHDKQSLIFNAFQQADGSTSRTYGGTGLGLSISRQLARSMGGEIALASTTGSGSTFTLFLPVSGACDVSAPPAPSVPPFQYAQKMQPELPAATIPPAAKKAPAELPPAPILDDRDQLQDGSKLILIIEDDLIFARILIKMVHDRGFQVIVADDGESGITLAERFLPSAIILDVMLPRIDGWGVMRSLKDNPATRHIPVHFITCLEERQKAMNMGAIGYVTKPVNSEQMDCVFTVLENAIEKTMKMLLIVEDDPDQASAMVALLEERNVVITVAESGAKAISLLSSEPFDCIVLDLGLADMGAYELLEELKILDPERRIPVIIHTGRDLSHEDEVRLHHYAESIIIKGAKSPERLLNEVTLFLHLVETSLDPDKQRMIRTALDKEAMLEGKKILIVDDDMRNIFSLSSALSDKNITIYEAENGCEALKRLNDFPDIDLVLMDIMMPEMDGYEAMRRIRTDPRFVNLPIIALTAKAMKGDREECLKAGANDYIPKPVDMDKLFSLLRVWLYNAAGESSEICER
jgi:CheY-like chemotaxis protein/putative methionine-R-sulfoxide reductase with GAF domain